MAVPDELPPDAPLPPPQSAEDIRAEYEAQQRATAQAAAAAAQKQAIDSHFQYGGWAGGAFEAANRYNTAGIAGQQRKGEVIDYGNANGDRALGMKSRAGQTTMADLMARRARGEVPSIAGMVGQQNIGRALADQSSIAAGARGPAALALAQQNQANNSANAVSTINQQTQVNAANERLQAEQAAFGAYSGMRGGDQALQGQDAHQAQAQAAMNAAQREANDRYQLGMTQAELDVQKSQLGAQQQQVALATGQSIAAANRASAESMHSDDRTDKYILGIGGAAAGVGAALLPLLWPGAGGGTQGSPAPGGVDFGSGGTQAGPGSGAGSASGSGDGSYNAGSGIYDNAGTGDSDPDPYGGIGRALGGPVRSGQAYVVGERGPEIVVPERNGVVIPHEQSRVALAGAGPRMSMSSMVRPGPGKNRTYSDDQTKLAAAESKAYALGRAHQADSSKAQPVPWAYEMPQDIAEPHQDTMSGDRGYRRSAGGKAAQSSADRASVVKAEKPKAEPGLMSRVLTGAGAGVRGVVNSARGMTESALQAPVDATRQGYMATVGPPQGQPMAPAAPSLAYQPPLQAQTMSDERTKQVGTLGPEVPHHDMAEFARSMRGVPYTYKPEYAEKEGQNPGELNVGPVAQEIEKSRVGRTIVKPDPAGSGMRTLDQSKMVKSLGAVVADQQEQLDEMRQSLMARRIGGRR